jgi:hypothetical protein
MLQPNQVLRTSCIKGVTYATEWRSKEAHRDTLRARVGLRRAPERGVRERAATKVVCRGGPSPDMGLAAMPTLFSGIGGVPTSGATGSMPYGLVATPACKFK